GLYIVPLYALIQARTALQERSRVVAANDILNALFMVVSALFAILVLTVVGLSIPQLFLAVSLLNVVVAGWIFHPVPEFVVRFRRWPLREPELPPARRNASPRVPQGVIRG